MDPPRDEVNAALERKRRYNRHYYDANKERLREYSRAYQKKHRERLNAYVRARYDEEKKAKRRRYYQENRERILENKKTYYAKKQPEICAYRKRNAKRLSKANSVWHRENRDRIRERKRLESRRRRERPTSHIAGSIRRRLSKLLNGQRSPARTEALVGCSFVELRGHLERQFRKGMSWENYGFRGWHIDHILPCSAFDLSREEELRRCFHFTNLRPLWARENLRKGAKVTDPQLKLLL